MWITVVAVFGCLLGSTVNSCPSLLNPCRTPNGTDGHCTQLKRCPPLSRIANNTNVYIQKFVTLSICGYDVDKSKLFCCDLTELDITPSQVTPCPPSIDSLPSQSVTQQEVRNKQDVLESNKDAVKPAVFEDTASFQSSCQTPNGLVARCISLFKCSSLLAAAMNSNDTNSKRFLRESKCGYEDGTFYVCCGRDVNFVNVDEAQYLNFRANPLLSNNACGREGSWSRSLHDNKQTNPSFSLENRIFGGTNSEINEFPWVALLQYENVGTGRRSFLCGGSLISSRYVVTAAHCIAPNPTDQIVGVRLGAWNFTNLGMSCVQTNTGRTCVEPAVDVGIQSVIAHPLYRARTRERYNDIALIRLRNDVTFTGHIKPICLPDPSDHTESGERLIISGFGLKNFNEQADIKQKVDVPVVPVSQCSTMFLKNYTINGADHILGRGQFCAGGETGKDACVGDSGAPAMKQQNSSLTGSRWYLTGVISYGIGCGFTDQYGVYTKVSEYVSWIHQTVVP